MRKNHLNNAKTNTRLKKCIIIRKVLVSNFFSCRKSLRFFSAHILKLCVFSQKGAWKTQNADQKLLLPVTVKTAFFLCWSSFCNVCEPLIVQMQYQWRNFTFISLRDSTEVWSCNTLKKKTYMFWLPTYLVYQNLFCGTLIYPLSIWQLGLKFECSIENEKNHH